MNVLRRERGVVVGRQVQVIGQGQEGAATGTGRAELRVQKTGLAAVINGETNVGPVEHRGIQHLKAHMPGGAKAFSLVQLDIRGNDGQSFWPGPQVVSRPSVISTWFSPMRDRDDASPRISDSCSRKVAVLISS